MIRPKPALTVESPITLRGRRGTGPCPPQRLHRPWRLPVSLDDRFDSPLRHEIKDFVEIFGAVLLTADDADALHDEIHQRDGKWLRVLAHSDQPAVWP